MNSTNDISFDIQDIFDATPYAGRTLHPGELQNWKQRKNRKAMRTANRRRQNRAKLPK